MERLGRRRQGVSALRLFQAWAAWRSVMKLQIGLWLDLSWSLAYCFDLPGTKFGFMPCGLWVSIHRPYIPGFFFSKAARLSGFCLL